MATCASHACMQERGVPDDAHAARHEHEQVCGEDVPLFISLIEDLFPAQKAERAAFPDISAALEKVLPVRGLDLNRHISIVCHH